MGTFTNGLLTVLLSWVRGLVALIWDAVEGNGSSLLVFFAKNWVVLAGVIILFGLVMDWLVWLARYKPYHLWAQRLRRRAGKNAETRKHSPAAQPQPEEAEDWLPMQPPVTEKEEQEILRRAEAVSDEEIGVYPGMRYDGEALQETKRYSDFAADTHKFTPVRSQEAQEKETGAEREARLKQEAYQRELEEYERKRAQYERDLAEYERQKAAYDREMAREQEAQRQADESAGSRRRRRSE